jgi:uncharacterized peroxidase-related enzyme
MGDDGVARQLARGRWAEADVDEADREMLRYAVLLTSEPDAVTSEDVAALRSHGFDDTAILDICQVTSYYNYVNRMADGLGVELEEGWSADDLVLTREAFETRARG